MGYVSRKKSIHMLADYLLKLANKHKDRGLVHVTYSMVQELRSCLGGNRRFMFHTRGDKKKQFAKWQESSDGIFVACGMQEGIDLVDDKARWQVIAKVNYPSLTDAMVAEKMRIKPEWYKLIAARGIIQAAGRVCRTPTDYGVTYITDEAFQPLFKNNPHLFPEWFIRSIIWPAKTDFKIY